LPNSPLPRPGKTPASTQKKAQTLEDIQDERFSETDRFLTLLRQGRQAGAPLDLDWAERSLRAALLQDGRRLLESIVATVPEPEYQRRSGQRAYAARSQTVLSAFGWLKYARTYYQAPGQAGSCPLDNVLGILGGCTPMAARLLCRTAARTPYVEGAGDLLELAGLEVDPSFIQQLAQLVGTRGQPLLERLTVPVPAGAQTIYFMTDGTGVPMAQPELEGRAGKGPDGQASTREAKLAAVFTQTILDAEGHPVRDPASTTYLGTFESSAEFGGRLRQAALARNLGQFSRQAYLGDGAAWVWTIGSQCFPAARQILDFYHGGEHVSELARLVFDDPGSAQNMTLRWQALLYDSELDVLLAEARQKTPPQKQAAVAKALQYFENNRERMDYKKYRQEGYFIGSGVVEAGCKKVIGGRLKQSGMFWKLPGANAVTILRCALLSATGWSQFWKMFYELPTARN
jgi:hypothetical protein